VFQGRENLAQRLDVPLAIIDKRRPKANVSEIMNIIGDVDNKRVILVDDLIDTGGQLLMLQMPLWK